jgi:prophage regulatory protein
MTETTGQQLDAFLPNDIAAKRAPPGPIHVLRLPQVCKMTGLCRSSIYQMEVELRFPRRIKIGARSVGWIESEVQSWLRQRVEVDRSR